MSRGSEIAIGIVCLLLSAALFILAPISGPTAPVGVWAILLCAAIAGFIGLCCVTAWGRPATSRVVAGALSIAMIAAAIAIALSENPRWGSIRFAGMVALMSGAYALSGFYPRWLPLSQVFGSERPARDIHEGEASNHPAAEGTARREYLIRRTDGEWFDLQAGQFAEVCRPNTLASRPVKGWGDHRIVVEGAEIAFSYEDPGIQVSVEGQLPENLARQVVDEVLANIERLTGQRGRIVEL